MKTRPALATAFLMIVAPLSPACSFLRAQESSRVAPSVRLGLILRVAARSLAPEALRNPDAVAWQSLPGQRVALNRTPPLYDTDPPATPEIPFVDVRLVRAGGKLLVHLGWRDATEDTAQLAHAPASPPETRDLKEQSAATERFFDAAAVMLPARAPENEIFPSLQMGDASDPVLIYYWNAAHGAVLVRAEGRGTTRRTGESFPAVSSYRQGAWRVVLELPDVSTGMPLALAIWNGSQLDRDGRKYFSVWLRVE